MNVINFSRTELRVLLLKFLLDDMVGTATEPLVISGFILCPGIISVRVGEDIAWESRVSILPIYEK